MRPLRRPAGRSRTTIFPMRKRASLMVLAGSSVRRRRPTTNFSGEVFGAARVKDIASESLGQQLLQVFERNEILVFSVLANETGDVRAERHDPEIIDTREIESKAGQFCRQAVAFERPRHFSVFENDAIRKAPIGEQGEKAINVYFEALRLFIVGDGNGVEIHGQELPY